MENEGVKNKPKLSFWQNLKLYGNDYTKNTTIHGVRYMGENRNHFEKLWWICVFIASLYLCSDQIVITYYKWRTSPVIVSFAHSPTPVWQIPFPAVTICPEVKILAAVYNFTNVYYYFVRHELKMNKSEIEQFESISLVCDSNMHNDGEDYANGAVLDYINEAAPKINDIFWSCKWNDETFTCSDYFKPILTDEGVCYTFNMLDREDIYKNNVLYHEDFQKHEMTRDGWTIEYGYKSDARDTFPKRAESTGTKKGLTLQLFSFNYEFDYLCKAGIPGGIADHLCKGFIPGFKVLLHHPTETPRIPAQHFKVPIEQELLVAVKPEMMTTSDLLRNYRPDQRKCYFSSERALQFYKNYTQQNCEVECLANFTLSECGCVSFHMPHEEGTKICGTGKTICMLDARDKFLDREVNKGINESKINVCNCIPACTSLEYNREISQAPYKWTGLFKAYQYENPYKQINFSSISIYIKESQFIPLERQELYGITDFLAKCGGLLNLFIGFSVMSFIEIIYYLTLRLFNNVRRYGKHLWSGHEARR